MFLAAVTCSLPGVGVIVINSFSVCVACAKTNDYDVDVGFASASLCQANVRWAKWMLILYRLNIGPQNANLLALGDRVS